MKQSFLPHDFKVPTRLETDDFHIRPLALDVAELDYEAVISCHKELRGIFGRHSSWPQPAMTLEQNNDSIKVHECEFESKEAFAYSVLNKDRTKCFGSIYIDPSRSKNHDCEVHYWIRTDSIHLELQLAKLISDWMQSHWPFKKAAYPGRDISWQDWEGII